MCDKHCSADLKELEEIKSEEEVSISYDHRVKFLWTGFIIFISETCDPSSILHNRQISDKLNFHGSVLIR